MANSRQYFKNGDFHAVCDVCGFDYFGSELRRRWDGMMVCPKDYENRPPQEFVRGIKEDVNPPFSRPLVDQTSLTGYVQVLAGTTTVTSTDLGSDNRVMVDVLPQLYSVYTEGAVTIVLNNTLTSAATIIIHKSESTAAVTVVDNTVGATIINT